MGTADLGGFVWQRSLDEYPEFSFFGLVTPEGSKQWGAEGVGVAYTEALAAGGGAPAVIAVAHTRAYPGAPDLKLSFDGGHTWAFTPSVNATLGPAAELLGVAVEAWPAGPSLRIVLLVSNSTPWASADGGATWARASGPLPSTPFPANGFSGNRYNMSRPLAADRPTAPGAARLFLFADCAAGGLLASPDGLEWAPRGAPAAFPPTPRCVIEPHPTSGGGSFWIAADEAGLFFTSDGGLSLRRDAAIARAYTVAAGAPLVAGGEQPPVVFVFGLLAGAPQGTALGVLASANAGGVWVSVPALGGQGLGNWPAAIAASRRPELSGVVVVGSFGRGALWANASDALARE